MPKMKNVVWQDPPAVSRRGKPPKDHLVAVAKRNPGKWLVYGRNMLPNYAASVRKTNPTLEVTARKSARGKGCDIYIRFISADTLNKEV